MRRAVHHTGAHLELRLLERLQERQRLTAVVHHIVLGAPDQEHGGFVVGGDRVAQWRGIEIDAAVLRGRDSQHALDQVVARIAKLRVSPLRQEIVDAVGPDQELHAAALFGMRVARIAAREQRAIAGERHQRGQMGAGGISPQRDPAGIEPEILGAPANELHRRANVVHHARIGLLAGLGQPVADRKAGISARREIRAPVLERVARAAPPIAAVNVNDDRERASADRQVEVAFELDAVVSSVGQVVMNFTGLVGHITPGTR